MEELLYRGLFLKQYEPFLGKGLSNLLTAVIFTLIHLQVTYPSDMVQFLFIALAFGLVWGYMMQKTDNIWGAVLFHAAGNLLVIFAAYARM
jgi:membrane protease YdiL (CAAX protease family)